MAYIGIQPAEKFTSFATQEFSTSATTSYTLDHAVANENELALFVNNVRQQPGSGKAYTATGTALTLSAATASTDTMYCVFLGRALQTVVPATNSITNAMITDSTITSAKLTGVTQGITSVTTFRLTSSLTGGSDATISANLSAVSSPSGYGQIGSQVTQSSGIFTFPATGIWSIEAFCSFIDVGGDTSCEVATQVTTDNSTYNNAASAIFGENDADTNRGVTCSKFIFDVTNTSTHKCLFRQVSFAGGTSLNGDSTLNRTYFIFTRLGDT